ncbi:MAG: ATP-binding cassette domain-containing protein [Clostridia bacterium]|nr:ATP-binding cassette domain-containing protein [Clostridia bacterium]
MTAATYLSKIPAHISEAIKARGIAIDDIVSYGYTDMDKDGNFADCWVFFDKENIYYLTGYDKIEKIRGRKKLKTVFDFVSFDIIPHEDIKSLEIERYVSTARLIAVKKEEGAPVEELMKFSLGIANKLDAFIRHFNDFKEGKPVEYSKKADEELFCPKCGTRYPDPEHKVCPKCMDKGSIFKRLLGFFKFYRKKLVVYFAMLVVSTAFSVLSPYVGTKLLYDNVLTPGVDANLFGEVGLVLLVIIAARILSLLINIGQNYIVAGIIPWVVYDLKVRIFSAMQKLSVSFYTSKQTGSLMTRVNRDSNNIYWFFVDGAPSVVVNGLMFIGILIIMFYMNWQLSLIVLVMIPLLLFLYRLIQRAFRKLHHARCINEANMSSYIRDSMSGQRIIKAFAKEKEEGERFSGYSGRSATADKRVSNAESTIFPLLGIVMMLTNLVVLFVGGTMIISHTNGMTLGKLMTFTAYMNMLYSPLDFLAWVSNWWARCVDSAQRIFEVMDAVPDVSEPENPVRIPEMKGDIEMKNVRFEYEPGHPIIKNLSLSVKAGHMVGIVGKTGAGKSTIVNLMARLYDVGDGEITIDGVNVKDIASIDMRKNIGIVSQEIYLFIGTIADNIRYANPGASMEEVIQAAKTASAHDFIMRLPDGYETRIGAGGQDLSGGEKQRISIARTIIQNPKILILDEATAAMDTETERNIQQALFNLQQGRTTVAIAHRLSTLRDADVLAVIDNGDMVEYGTHDELIKKQGEYYKLYMLQFDAIKHIGIGE